MLPNCKDDVDFLVARRFPLAPIVRGRAAFGVTNNTGELQDLEAYERQLQTMPRIEFEALLAAERTKEQAEVQARAEQQEKNRFFSRPAATADIAYWSKLAFWSLDEAVALSFGKAPDIVHWTVIKGLENLSPFAKKYSQLRTLVERAEVARQLSTPVAPKDYIAWAKRNDISVPGDLEAAVSARNAQCTDREVRYVQGKLTTVEIAAKPDLATASVNELRDLVRTLQTQPAHAEKPLGTTERNSLLKLVMGMAQGAYAYNPGAAKSTVVSEITADLDRCGISLHPDTIRKYLDEASNNPHISDK